VFLFYLFMHGHPFEGMATDATYSWAAADHQSESHLAMRHFGQEPVFVFDSRDHSNRPRSGDLMLTWWPIYPRFFRALFEQAFTAGLSPGLAVAYAWHVAAPRWPFISGILSPWCNRAAGMMGYLLSRPASWRRPQGRGRGVVRGGGDGSDRAGAGDRRRRGACRDDRRLLAQAAAGR
jgi:hypothetical protein